MQKKSDISPFLFFCSRSPVKSIIAHATSGACDASQHSRRLLCVSSMPVRCRDVEQSAHFALLHASRDLMTLTHVHTGFIHA
jgi:hypothetical protein